mmetsp:Transcript_9800/g.28463  ORF Transcript_9800/g.28463 Transcript_9800/m.28463 type:complete len:251 (-) Transcript_9800:397-1149(-)
MWLKVRNNNSCGSGAALTVIGVFTPVCTCAIQSKRMVRIFAVCGAIRSALRTRPSSKKTSHLAARKIIRFTSALIGLPHRSNSSSCMLRERAAASASPPAFPIIFWHNATRRSAQPGSASRSASAAAPASPMPFPPRHSSPSIVFGALRSPTATARAPRSPRATPASSSSTRRGAAQRHSKAAVARHTARMRMRPEKEGSKSMIVCSISGNIPASFRCSTAASRRPLAMPNPREDSTHTLIGARAEAGGN